MAQEVKIAGALFSDVPTIRVPDSNDVYHPFTDVSDTTATASDVANGKYFYAADGTKTAGTSSGGGGTFAPHKALIVKGSSAYYQVYVEYNGVTYTHLGDSFVFNEGDAIYLEQSYGDSNQIYVDGVMVSSAQGPTDYNYVAPAHDILITCTGVRYLRQMYVTEDTGIEIVKQDALSVTANDTYTAPAGYLYSPVTASVPTGITPTGSTSITTNGTYDVTNYASAEVNVPISTTVEALSVTQNGTYTAPSGTAYSPVTVNVSGSGASNYIHGEFTTNSSSGVQTVTIPYTGTGYPIMAYVVVKGGAYAEGTTWYDTINRYAVGIWAMSKADMSTTPTYSTTGSENYGSVFSIYKNSTSSATSYSSTYSMNVNTLSSSNAYANGLLAIRFTNNTTMTVFVKSTRNGLLPGIDYEYFIAYSS